MKSNKTKLAESEEFQNARKDKQSCFSSFKRWLVKGTIAEPWPTAEELLNDPKVKNEIKKVREAFGEVKKQQNNQ